MKRPTCKNPTCRKEFTPRYNSTQQVCSKRCAIAYTRQRSAKKEKAEWNERKKELLVKVRKHSWYENQLQDVVNAIARAIDYGRNCASCKDYPKKPQGGHFHSVGSNNSLRYNLHNIHLQCYQCNERKSSNRPGYEEGLEKRYGKRYLEYVKFTIVREAGDKKLSVFELQEATRKARVWLRFILTLNEGANGELPTAKQCIELRRQANKFIGIFKN